MNWNFANQWQEAANKLKDKHVEPTWEWDCNFKLNLDGPIISVSGRFYPPHKNTGDFWEGTMQVKLLGIGILRKEFKTSTMDDLTEKVEKSLQEYSEAIKQCLSTERITEELRKLGTHL